MWATTIQLTLSLQGLSVEWPVPGKWRAKGGRKELAAKEGLLAHVCNHPPPVPTQGYNSQFHLLLEAGQKIYQTNTFEARRNFVPKKANFKKVPQK